MQQNRTRHRVRALLLDLLWPNICDCCGSRIPYDLLICEACAEKLHEQQISYQAWAKHNPYQKPWADAALLFSYEKTARSGVLNMKTGRRGFCSYSAEMLAAQIRDEWSAVRFSCVTWIPMLPERRRIQSYSHSENFGLALAEALHLPARGDLLTEQKSRLRQHELNAAERAVHVQKYQLCGKRLDGQTVLLTDDIITTGSTLRRCAELLLSAGAEQVYIAAICGTLEKNA